MPKVYLKRNRVIEITAEQSLQLAKSILLLPAYQQLKINGVVFTVEDLDHEAYKKANWPEQMRLDVRVKTVDKKPRKSME